MVSLPSPPLMVSRWVLPVRVLLPAPPWIVMVSVKLAQLVKTMPDMSNARTARMPITI